MKIGQAIQSTLRVLVGLITSAVSIVLIGGLFNGLTEYFGPEIPAVDPLVYDWPTEEEFLEFLVDVESDSTQDREAGLPVYPPRDSTEIAAELEIYHYFNSWRSTWDWFLQMFWLVVAITAIAPQSVSLFRQYGGITWDQKPNLIPWWFTLTAILSVVGAIMLYQNDLKFFSVPLLGLALWQVQQILDRFINKDLEEIREDMAEIKKTAKTPLVPQTVTGTVIPDDVSTLWSLSLWLARNFKILWPGGPKSDEEKETYLAKLEEYNDFLEERSITLPNDILAFAGSVYGAIHEYKIGKDMRWDPPYDPESSHLGGQQMSSGAKNFNRAFGELRQATRGEYGVE